MAPKQVHLHCHQLSPMPTLQQKNPNTSQLSTWPGIKDHDQIGTGWKQKLWMFSHETQFTRKGEEDKGAGAGKWATFQKTGLDLL